jgi:RHS repeat-associated protein
MQLTGHERDQSSGLDYLHARYYNPNVARFLSVDPGPPSARVPQSWNRYAYVLNNPINATDPDGQLPEWLKKLWGWVTGQEAQNAVNQAVDDATKASTERSEQERQQDAELLQVAGLHASNAGAVLGTGGAKFAEGARQGVKDLAGPVAREVTGAVVAAGVVKVIRVGGVLLNEAQAANLARFQQKLPRGAGAVTIQEFGNGARAFVSEVPGRVPGSRAAYIKEVGASGETTRYVKVTFAPDGSVVSVKQKY